MSTTECLCNEPYIPEWDFNDEKGNIKEGNDDFKDSTKLVPKHQTAFLKS